MSRLRIQAFGGLQVFAAGPQPVPLPARKAQALLAWLALHPGRPHRRAKLAALLWGDSSEAQARASLRQALLVLRKALDLADDELIAGPGETIEWAHGCAVVDVLEFERLLDEGAGDALERAAALYTGELLEAVDTRQPAFDDWLMARRQQLRERAVDTLARLLALHADAGHVGRAIEAALRLLAFDPLQESVHRQLMQLYARQGRHAEALRQFQSCRDILAREIGARPQAQTVLLRDEIERSRHAPTAPAQAQRAGGPESGEAPAERSDARAELRLVTVVAAEATSLSEQADPERAQAACQQFAAAAGTLVDHLGGLLEQRLGGGILAWFGAATAHRDDTERAGRCALQLRALAGDVRAGISCGSVLVSRQPEADGQAARISGEPAAVAAQLAAAAAPGEVLVSDVCWQALAHIAEGVPCAEAALPASLRARACWRLAGMRPAPASRTHLVGRRTELGQFTSTLLSCLDSGTGLTIHLRGDPGIGKTRLVEEFREIARKHGFACHTGLVLDFGHGAGRDAVRSLLRGLLDLRGSDPEADRALIGSAIAAGRIDAAHEAQLLEMLQLPMSAPLRAAFDAMDDATRKRRQAELLSTLLQRCCQQMPRLLVIEDVHWAQPLTLAQAAALAAAAERCACVLVTTARGEGDPLNAAWRATAGVSALVTLDLGPLRWTEASALASQLGAGDDAFALRCIERSGGNPLFLVQLMQGGRDAGAALPGSVQSVVQARLDLLAEDERHRVRVASVLGQRFPLPALNHLLGTAADCVPQFASGLLRCEAAEGVFAHALVHEGAYASLPHTQRRELHARAAHWFAGRDPVLHAEHLDRAELPEAAQACLDAARFEAAAHRHERALRWVDRGLALAGAQGPRFALACCRADLLHDLGAMPEAQAGYEAALAAAANDVERCRAWIGVAGVLRVRDDLDGAAAALSQAEQAARQHRLPEQAARIHLLRGNLRFPRGDLEGCQREHAQSLALARQAGSVELETAALGGLGDAAYLGGQMLTARERFAACVAIAQRHGLKRVEAANRPMAAITGWYAGEVRAAREEAHAAIEVAVQIGHRRAEMIAQHGAYILGRACMAFDEALQHAERALVLARQIDAPRFEAEALAFRGELRRTIGQRTEALEDLRGALVIARASGMAFMGPIFLGMLARAEPDAAARDAALAEAEALLSGNGLAHNHLMFRHDAIDACLEAGDPAGALRHAAELEARTQAEPLPWSDFLVARARALAAHTAHAPDPSARATLVRLREDGQRMGLLADTVAIEAALSQEPG